MAKNITRTFNGTHYEVTCATADRQWRSFRISLTDTAKLDTEMKVKNKLQNYLNTMVKISGHVFEKITDKDGNERYEYVELKQNVAVMFIDSQAPFEELRAMDVNDFYALSKPIKIDGMEVE